MIVLWIVLIVPVGIYVTWKLLKRGKSRSSEAFTCDGKQVILEFRYGSKLPKALHASGTTVTPVVCFRTYPPNYPVQVVGRPPISAGLVAHEVGGHVVRRLRVGAVRFWWEIYRDIALHPFNHDARKSEQQAEADGKLLLSGKLDGVDAELMLERFR